jgi:hypothetical protein
MPRPPRHQVLKPRFTTVEMYRLLDTYLRAGEDIAGRPLRVTLDAMRRTSHLVVRGLLGPWSTEQVVTGLAEEFANWLYGLITAAPTAIESIRHGPRRVCSQSIRLRCSRSSIRPGD